jgi:hypothetical protein
MYYQQKDWILREIEMMTHFIVVSLFGKNVELYELENEDLSESSSPLHKEILKRLESKDVCGAEDALFDYIDSHGTLTDDIAKTAVFFYSSINSWTDSELERADFSREEIAQGLKEISNRLGLPDISTQ